MDFKGGDKLFYIELKDNEIVNKEWVTVEKTYYLPFEVCEIKLSNNTSFYDGGGYGGEIRTNGPNMLVNHFVDRYVFISTSENDCYKGILSFFENEKMKLFNQIKNIEKDIANIDSMMTMTKLL